MKENTLKQQLKPLNIFGPKLIFKKSKFSQFLSLCLLFYSYLADTKKN